MKESAHKSFTRVSVKKKERERESGKRQRLDLSRPTDICIRARERESKRMDPYYTHGCVGEREISDLNAKWLVK